MTGYGQASVQIADETFKVEARSLNSKSLDYKIKLPFKFRNYEAETKNIISEKLLRGKIEIWINSENNSDETVSEINLSLAEKYYQQLKELSKITGQDNPDYMSLIMRLPDVVSSSKESENEEEWNRLKQAIISCLDKLNEFRQSEGKALHKDLSERLSNIKNRCTEIQSKAPERVNSIRERIQKGLNDFVAKENIDNNRLEQELIFYIEKLDITEEIIRLNAHLDYFELTMEKEENQGRKLNFISQEIGREINTIGSKANHSAIQMLVVQMKDELEKIKEQLSNVL
jgi:uncharacterized protein (TIGR00255 family)